MSHHYPFYKPIDLFVRKHISEEDARRQERTASEILVRLKDQPGVVLADEVGMGKTFVALAVAVSVALANRGRRPVVIMVPPSLQDKWPRDFDLFLSKCLPPESRALLRGGRAKRAEEFLKFLDDPPDRRCNILFVTHGAMSRGLTDRWVKLAFIRQALHRRRGIEGLKDDLAKILGRILQIKRLDKSHGPALWGDLLSTSPRKWLDVLQRHGLDPEEDGNHIADDDPVPKAVCDVLDKLDTDELFSVLQEIPRRKSDSMDKRIQTARQKIQSCLPPLWAKCIANARLRLPLLILDEAHHLKNEDTILASLFRCPDAEEDMSAITRGALGEVFERMVFLTATPFQLGHGELCSVLERFGGIAWRSRIAPRCGKEGFLTKVAAVRKALDAAQEASLRLDDAWGRLREEHLAFDGTPCADTEAWWRSLPMRENNVPEVDRVIRCFASAESKMREAERELRPWIIRHLKPRQLPAPNAAISRRTRLTGNAIATGCEVSGVQGLEVDKECLVPFLLAARATACAPTTRSVFAEGLASSYEAFRHTREASRRRTGIKATDGDDDPPSPQVESSGELDWYMARLEECVPRDDASASMSHPKIMATAKRVVHSWLQGEKTLVFCHFVATGKALRRAISHAIRQEITRLGAEKLACSETQVIETLTRLGDRFYKKGSPIRRACDEQINSLIGRFPCLADHQEQILEATRRMVRTPTFLIRFFPLKDGRLREEDMAEALRRSDQSGMTLEQLLCNFFTFLQDRCDESGRKAFIHAIGGIQTGTHTSATADSVYLEGELQGENVNVLMPNVRLVNGTTPQDSRQKLMLAFNTPFYPDVLVASSVMAEGVDLHLNCRHVIHHDLCWNPSTLEQRTGRVDRVGAKAEHCGQSIHVYLPFLSATQDEKMYRVVTDRERWFSVVMGDKFDPSEQNTDKLARRVPLPESAARQLALRLEVGCKETLMGDNRQPGGDVLQSSLT